MHDELFKMRHSTATQLLQAGSTSTRSALGSARCRSTPPIYAETDMATKKRALATLVQGRTRKTSGGWSRRPEVMEFLRSL